ncbi:MAG: MgtC/SapB family protein [Clostridia bacterium]|nr:MgtC/SapB family protein [Clostridia bacterium]
MDQFMDYLFPHIFDQPAYIDIIIRIISAILIGGIIGFEREKHNRPAGLRTHILVCLGACSMALIECLISSEMLSASAGDTGVTITFGRIVAQVVSGVGFLGAGTIVLSKRKISGLTTAASLWNVACIGIAVGYGFYFVAYLACFMILIVLALLSKIIRVNTEKRVEVKFIHRVETMDFINAYFEEKNIQVLDIDFHVEITEKNNLYTNVYSLKLPSKVSYTDIVAHLSEFKNVQGVRTTNL